MSTQTDTGIVLSQTASWNAALTNTYRTRYASAGGRYFRVSAERLDGVWYIDEITKWDVSLGIIGVALRLSEARAVIAKKVGGNDERS